MIENLSNHFEDDTPEDSINGKETTKIHMGEGKTGRWRQLTIPIYGGESDAYSWINKFEGFFPMRDILEEEKF